MRRTQWRRAPFRTVASPLGALAGRVDPDELQFLLAVILYVDVMDAKDVHLATLAVTPRARPYLSVSVIGETLLHFSPHLLSSLLLIQPHLGLKDSVLCIPHVHASALILFKG
jgi:hypothetical protein